MQNLTKPEQRRQGMVKAVRDGKSYQEVAQKFGVAVSTVHKACKQAGLPSQQCKLLSHSTFSIIADLINTDLTIAEIRRKHALSRQRIHTLVKKCLAAGIKIKGRRS